MELGIVPSDGRKLSRKPFPIFYKSNEFPFPLAIALRFLPIKIVEEIFERGHYFGRNRETKEAIIFKGK